MFPQQYFELGFIALLSHTVTRTKCLWDIDTMGYEGMWAGPGNYIPNVLMEMWHEQKYSSFPVLHNIGIFV